MALPVTITTDGLATKGVGGPFISSGGNIYVCVPSDNLYNLRMFGATGSDATPAFTNRGTDVVIGAGTDVIQSVDAYQVGDVIHVVTKNSSGTANIDIRYHIFNIASQTWTTSNEMVIENRQIEDTAGSYANRAGVVVRPGDDVIVLYNGSPETVASVVYARVYYARREAGVWTTDITVGTATVAANWVGGSAVLGTDGRVHFFFTDVTNGDVYQRTLTSANALQALPAAFDTTVEVDGLVVEQRGALITSVGAVVFPYYDTFQTLNEISFVSGDAPTLSVGAGITSTTGILTNPIRAVASYAIDGNTNYNAFIDVNKDVYTQSRSSDSETWSGPSAFYTASVSAIYTNVYTRNGDRVLAMILQESGDPVYHEKVLSQSSSGVVVRMGSLGMMRAGK